MSLYTRDDSRYWRHRPADHNVAGFFVFGPQESRPSLFREVETGEANRSDEAPSQVLARQRYQRAQRKMRLARLVRAVLAA
jgi:hypothetical protein